MSQQCKARRVWDSINPNTPTTCNHSMEGRKKKNSKRQKEQIRPTGKHWLCLKPTSPTPSKKVTKIVTMKHWEGHKGFMVLRSPTVRRRLRWVLMSNQAPQVICAGTYGKGNAPLRGWIGLLLILKSMHNAVTDQQSARLCCESPPVK